MGISFLLFLGAIVFALYDAFILAVTRLWGPVIQSILSVLLFLAIYSLAYWLFLLAGNLRFISIYRFRVWGSLAHIFDGDGIATWLGDEVRKLQGEMKYVRISDPGSRGEEKPSFYRRGKIEIEVPSPAMVTVQYKGISPDVLNSYLRRLFGRQEMITGDLIADEAGFFLLIRLGDVPPWDVQTQSINTLALHHALQEMAVRVISGLWPQTTEMLGNTLVARQLKADEERNYDESLWQARLAQIVAPASETTYYNLGVAFGRKGQLDEAIEAYHKALTINPPNPEALINLSISRGKKGQLNKAIAYLRKATALNPDNTSAHYNLGVALSKKGQLDEAIAAYRRAISLDHHHREARLALGITISRKGLLDEAIEAYHEVLSDNPDDPRTLINLGIALSEKGQLDESIAVFQKVLSNDPDDRDALINLGNALSEKGQLDEAIEAYREVLSDNPDDRDARNNLELAELALRKTGRETRTQK